MPTSLLSRAPFIAEERVTKFIGVPSFTSAASESPPVPLGVPSLFRFGMGVRNVS